MFFQLNQLIITITNYNTALKLNTFSNLTIKLTGSIGPIHCFNNILSFLLSTINVFYFVNIFCFNLPFNIISNLLIGQNYQIE